METVKHRAVGIDLGTTFSVVAYLDSNGRPKTIMNEEGDLITPSVVLFESTGVVVGKEAVNGSTFEPERIAQFAKRDMGSPVYSRDIKGQQLPPEVIQSFVLAKLKRDAEAKIGPISQVVITVPAFFNEPRRKATQDAGTLAGLEVLDIINEPTAAAIAFGFEQGFLNERGESTRSERVLVYDLGGGTFDVTLMEIDGKNYSVLATRGDVYLGGMDWDKRLVDHLAEEFKSQFKGVDPRENPAGLQRLLRDAEAAKRSLSARESATISFEYAGHGLRTQVTRQDFERLTADLLERTRFTTSKVLEDARLEWKDVTRLLLVGGSCRMPMVRQMLEQFSGKTPDVSLSFDEAIAHGAAIYAGILLSDASSKPRATIKNVNSHDLGVLGIEETTGRPRRTVLIPRNTPIPASNTKSFKTFKADQRSVVVNIIEGGDDSGNNSTPIGKCTIRDLPPDLPASTPVEVTFAYEHNGRLIVNASLPTHHREATMAIERASGQSETALKEWQRKLTDPTGAAGIFSVSKNDVQKTETKVAATSLPEDGGPPAIPPQSSRPATPPQLPPKNAPPPLTVANVKTKGPPPLANDKPKTPPPLANVQPTVPPPLANVKPKVPPPRPPQSDQSKGPPPMPK